MNQLSQIVLGLDGGGTKTVCVAVESAPGADDREPLARVVVGSTNRNSVGAPVARANLADAIERTLQSAARSRAELDAICLGISGVDRPEDHAQVQQWLAEILPDVPAFLYNDAVVALASGTRGQLYGIVLISGTGMIAMGYNRRGERRRAGGWGAILGDDGSGYTIGAATLRAVTWAADGRGPETSLTAAVLNTLHFTRAEQLVRWAYDDLSWNRIADLAPLANQEAAAGDAQAQRIVRQASLDLALAVEAVARRLGMENEAFPIVLAGGGLRPGYLADSLCARFGRSLPMASIVIPSAEPAIGAALLAISHVRQAAPPNSP